MAKDTSSTTKSASHYSASDITVLEGLEPVRKRPGMYIGTTGPDGLHHLITEVFDNSRDEAMGGFADRIEIALLPGNRVRVVDNGRGIPVDKHTKTKVSALETIMTTLHAGGKFGGEGYKVSGGLHGVGVSVVNALSIYARAEVHRDGGAYAQEYSRGQKKAEVKKIGASADTGTIITFEPDEEIFKEVTFSFNRIVNHMRQQAYLVRKLYISVLDARAYEGDIDKLLDGGKEKRLSYVKDLGLNIPSQTFYFEGGLVSLIRFYNEPFKTIHKNIFYVHKENSEDNVEVEVAMQYADDISNRILPFANNIYNPEGGTHITGFKTALTRTLNSYARSSNLLKDKDDNFGGDDVLEGITAVVSVKLPEIQFEGQTKAKLGSQEARGAVESALSTALGTFLEENPDDAKLIINKVLLALRARKAAKAAKDSVLRKGALEGMTLPGKLADCSSRSAENSELFIVEGDSAGGSAKQGRDNKTQAILPLRGKILNVERARLDRMLGSEMIRNLVVALGTAIGETFDIEKLRYHKVIIATDADVDGAHIRTLLLTLFFRYFRPLIEGGYIYIAQPPLYKIEQGKKVEYVYSDEQKASILKELGIEESEVVTEESDESDGTIVETSDDETVTAGKGKKVSIQRYKGLGEMNPEELWETTMDPTNRVLKQVGIEDAQEADRIFDILMGTDVSARKSFIQSNAKMATIDI
jgi:DNA gyrase subunit B